jgi:hypothetical protein
MKRAGLLLVAFLTLVPSLRGEAQGLSGVYQAISDYFNPDPNAGLTAFRSLLIPMGGLAEGMGQAYTAASRDSSYFESNPAASSLLPQTELAVYHNNWIADTKIEGSVYTIRLGDLGLGIYGKWLYLDFPQFDQFGNATSDGYYSEAIMGVNVAYNFLAGYNFAGIALGATLKGAYRVVPSSITEAVGNSAAAIMGDFGGLVRFNFLKFYSSRSKNCAFGLAIKNLGPPVQDEPLPTVASAGISYSPLRPLTFAFDLSKPINLVDPSSSEAFIWAFGVSGSLTDYFKLDGGFLLKGGNPRLSLGTSFNIDLVRLTVNYTLDLTTQATPFNRISVEASFALGDLGRADLAKKVDNLYLSGLDAYAKGDTAAAAAAWAEALKIDPRFDPAKESLKALQGFQNLLDSINKAQVLN